MWVFDVWQLSYIFPIQFYILKLTYRAYTVQLEGNSDLDTHHYKFISAENIVIYTVSSDDYTYSSWGWKTENMVYSLYVYGKKRKKGRKKNLYNILNSLAGLKGFKTIKW